jgi:hypothetical protein
MQTGCALDRRASMLGMLQMMGGLLSPWPRDQQLDAAAFPMRSMKVGTLFLSI